MFIYKGKNKKIIEAVEQANSFELLGFVAEDIRIYTQFDMSNTRNEHIADELEMFLHRNDIEIVTYKPKWRWSKAYGYFSPNKPNTIHLNQYKLNRSIASFVGTFFHELTHMTDNADKYYSYGHGDNNPKGKEHTAPYFIGNSASEYFDISNNDDLGSIVYYVPWYERVVSAIRKFLLK